MLSREHSLRKEMEELFERNDRANSRVFLRQVGDKAWVIRLAYLGYFLTLKFPKQVTSGKFTTVIHIIDKIRAFIMMLDLWEIKTMDGNVNIFENVITLGIINEKGHNGASASAPFLLKRRFKLYLPDLSELDLKLKTVHCIRALNTQQCAGRIH